MPQLLSSTGWSCSGCSTNTNLAWWRQKFSVQESWSSGMLCMLVYCPELACFRDPMGGLQHTKTFGDRLQWSWPILMQVSRSCYFLSPNILGKWCQFQIQLKDDQSRSALPVRYYAFASIGGGIKRRFSVASPMLCYILVHTSIRRCFKSFTSCTFVC